jgi:hypothetical protein
MYAKAPATFPQPTAAKLAPVGMCVIFFLETPARGAATVVVVYIVPITYSSEQGLLRKPHSGQQGLHLNMFVSTMCNCSGKDTFVGQDVAHKQDATCKNAGLLTR